MDKFVRERIKQIVASYPIGKEFTSNCIHAELFQKHGPGFLPSRVAVAAQLGELPQLSVVIGSDRLNRYVKA